MWIVMDNHSVCPWPRLFTASTIQTAILGLLTTWISYSPHWASDDSIKDMPLKRLEQKRPRNSEALIGLSYYRSPPDAKEYCHLEKFEGKCPDGHVIMMEHAQYGRMKLGRCLTRDYYVGCTADVLGHMDQRCSGRQQCEVVMPDATLFRAQPCPKDLVVYLDAEYTCMKGQGSEKGRCKLGTVLPAHSHSGYLTSHEAQTHNIGSKNCPWNITAQPGQRINITLYDFNSYGSMVSPSSRRHEQCTIYATIQETIDGSVQETVVCGSRIRHHVVYSSKTNVIFVQIQRHPSENPPAFALRYDAIGCPDPSTPPHAVLSRTGDKVHIVCNDSLKSRHLVCKGTSWVGDMANCSADAGRHSTKLETGVSQSSLLSFPNGLLLAVVIGIALGLLIGVCLLVFVYTVRRRRRRGRRNNFMKEANALLGPEQLVQGDNSKQNMSGVYDSRENSMRLARQDNVEITTSIPMTLIRHGDHVCEKPASGQEIKVIHAPSASPTRHLVPNYCGGDCPDVVDVNASDIDRMRTLPFGYRPGPKMGNNPCGCDYHGPL